MKWTLPNRVSAGDIRDWSWQSVCLTGRACLKPSTSAERQSHCTDDDTIIHVSDPILLFLTVDLGALLLLGLLASRLPSAIAGLLACGFCGLGLLLGLPAVLMAWPEGRLGLPIGPPGLSIRFALDPLSAFFLVMVLFPTTTLMAILTAAAVPGQQASIRMVAACVVGIVVAILAADGIALALGLALGGAAVWRPRSSGSGLGGLMVPFLVLSAICLLTPVGSVTDFDAIRSVAANSDQAGIAIALAVAAMAILVRSPGDNRGWVQETLIASVFIPFAIYLLLRVTLDLSAGQLQARWGFVLLLAGALYAVLQSWRAAAHPEMDVAISSLTQRQAGLATITIGLAMIARAADLPDAADFALKATCLTAIGTAFGGTITLVAVHAMGTSVGTYRFSRLGGLIHSMPGTSAAMAAGLLTLSALPPGVGFAGLWLSYQSILLAPRTGGLLSQLPLAVVAGAIALSAALATTASVRVIGIAILGRPRTPQGAGAQEGRSSVRLLLLTLGGVSLLPGVLPGLLLWLMAEPAIGVLTDFYASHRSAIAVLSVTNASPTYLPLPVMALLALSTGVVLLASGRRGNNAKSTGPWTDGMQTPAGLPFGEPAAQSAGSGFVPNLPKLPTPRLPRLTTRTAVRPPPVIAFVWLMLAAFATLLLVIAVTQ